MNVLLLYLLLLKSTITAFSGPSSLPVMRDELVVKRHVLTDAQLTTAVVVGRTTPGPNGLYVVCVGYYVGGLPGALAGWLAVATPALLVIPLLRFLGNHTSHPILRSVLDSVILGSIGLVMVTIVPLARSSATGIVPAAAAIGSCALLILTRIHTFWIVAGAAALTVVAFALGV